MFMAGVAARHGVGDGHLDAVCALRVLTFSADRIHLLGILMASGPYLQKVAAFTLILGAMLGAFSIGIDPTGSFGVRTEGFYFRADRPAKFHLMKRQKYILLASSIGFSFDPNSVASPQVFNGAQSGLSAEEALYYVDNSAKNATYVALGLDCISLFSPHQPIIEPNYGHWTETIGQYGFSTNGVKMAALTLWHEWRGRPFEQYGNGYEDPHWTQREADNPGKRRSDLLAAMTQNLISASPDRFPYLQRLQATLEQRGTRYKVFLQPVSLVAMDYFRAHGAIARVEECRARVKRIFPDVLDLTESEFANNENFYPGDVLHYGPATATAVLRRVLVESGIDVQ
jgi:hypothetical protein